MPAEVSVVITTHDSARTIGRTLASLLDLGSFERPGNILVFDNSSHDGTADIARSFRGVRTVVSGRNLGLARANNIAANLCGQGAVLFLNPDVIILPEAISTLSDFCEARPDTGVAGPGMVSPDGSLQPSARRFPDLASIAARRTPFGRTRAGREARNRHMSCCDQDGMEPFRADWLMGAALWITPRGRRTFGLMSERYFLYFEDVELCWRAWASGMEVWLVPGARMEHVARRQSAGRPGRALWLHLRSMLRFYADHPKAIMGRCSTDL